MTSTTPRFCILTFVAFVLFVAVTVFLMLGTAVSSRIQEYRDFRPTSITAEVRQKELDCLARNIYWEAAGEPFEGKVAVAQVTLNRVASPDFPMEVCQVVYQRDVFRNRIVCQFSWFCERNHLFRPIRPEEYAEAQKVARQVLLEDFRLPGLEKALYYHADYVNPRWKKPVITKIGRHIFYEEKQRGSI